MATNSRETHVVLLSGPIGAGKTTLAKGLVERRQFRRLFTRDAILRRQPQTQRRRLDLQIAGERLDRETEGRWVAEELTSLLSDSDPGGGIVVDAVMIPAQVAAIRSLSSVMILHAHLTAPVDLLASRYSTKQSGIAEAPRYADVRENRTEATVEKMGEIADLVIDTSVTSVEDAVRLVSARLP